jgi:hypothetical protein
MVIIQRIIYLFFRASLMINAGADTSAAKPEVAAASEVDAAMNGRDTWHETWHEIWHGCRA